MSSQIQQDRTRRPFTLQAFGALAILCCTAAPALAQNSSVISEIRVIGNRRIPKETVLARVISHVGDTYDPATVERDFNSLWNTGYFEDVRIEKEDTPQGQILDIFVREKPTIREINYKGLSSVSQSDVLDRFKKEKVGLTVESQYDPTHIARAVAVLKQLLGEHGHQFPTIRTDVKTIPPASVAVNFIVKEGPTVKVGNIRFTGNRNLSSRNLRASMKNLKPIGVPRSIFLENLFARTYDASKLEEDSERVRVNYQNHGYFKAIVGEPSTHIRNEGGLSLLTFRPKKGKRIDINLPIEEGERYRLGGITFKGNSNNINVRGLRSQFAIKDGDFFNYTAIGKGLENLRKAYGSLGFINFVANPTTRFDEAKKTLYIDVDIDEGKPFFVSRIEFTGNTVTRDPVIRRELLLEEGQRYNSATWEQSLLRLNQLDYFDALKVDQDSTATQDQENNTVSLLLKVHEKGKNSIGLNGGVSGLSGSFLGVNYSTNNFLGLGETLSVQANIGNLSRNLQFGFTEPYFRNKPVSLGFQVFSSKSDFNSARNQIATGGGNLSAAQQALVQNYNQSSTGLSVSANYLIKHSFNRVGITYAFNRSSIQAFSPASTSLFQTLAFRSGIQGQNALNGIYSSNVSLSFSRNTIGNPYNPHEGQEISTVLQVAGIGGNVKYINPIVEYRHFNGMRGLRVSKEGRNVLGVRLQASYIQGIGGKVAPPFQRVYQGGEQELRGFDIRSGTPYAFIPQRTQFLLTNPDGTLVPRDPTNPTLGSITVPIPTFGIVSVGGDTAFSSNIEYRIPLGGPVSFKFYDDFGINVAVRQSQLRESVLGIDALNAPLYGCPVFVNGACQGGSRVNFRNEIRPLEGTNVVPRTSVGAELSVLLPIVRAPFRIYYAYNPLRLLQEVRGENLITRDLFPAGGAGDFSYAQALQLYGPLYQLREPRKTFRLSVGTTF
jgi:outer membrane protein insertion porin family